MMRSSIRYWYGYGSHAGLACIVLRLAFGQILGQNFFLVRSRFTGGMLGIEVCLCDLLGAVAVSIVTVGVVVEIFEFVVTRS